MEGQQDYYSLNLRRIECDLVTELYEIKWIWNKPIYALVQQAIEYWLEHVGRPEFIWPFEYDSTDSPDAEATPSDG